MVLSVGVIFAMIACWGDLRFLILSLIVILTVFPSLAFFLSVKYMFAPDLLANFLSHTIEHQADGYCLRIYRPADQKDSLEADKMWIESETLFLFDSNVIIKKTTNDYDVVFFKNSPLSILFIPKY